MSSYRPIAVTLTAATATYLLLVAIEPGALAPQGMTPSLVLWFLVGLVYTQLFEFWTHQIPMHRGLPFLTGVRRSHLEHHREFYGERFRTRDPDALVHIAGRFWAFPLLMVAHYALLRPSLGGAATSAFLLAALAHYLVFEATHWFTHVEDNGFDRFVARLPWIAGLRARQIEHHRQHHEVPVYAFNFNPPYLGDGLMGLMPRLVEPRAAVASPAVPHTPLPEAAPGSTGRLRPWLRPALGYGSALAVGLAIVGLAVVAHGRWSENRTQAAVRDQMG